MQGETELILPFPPWYNLKPSFQFYPTKSANHSGRGVSLLITETITHIKDNRGIIRRKES